MKALTSRPAEVKGFPAQQPAIFLEALEPRIAPASLVGIDYKAITLGSPQLLQAGEGLSTSSGSGSYILAVEKGQALVFTTDLNGNNQFDPNEITGIAAGNGLRFTSFVDINGDVVTNLQSDGNLSDSDGIAANGRDGLLLLNSKIEGITLRSVTSADLAGGDTVSNRLILSSYSIHGNVYAGGGIGVAGAGIVIDTVGLAAQVSKFTGSASDYQVSTIVPDLGAIKTGTAAGEQYFNFGYQSVGPSVGDLQKGGQLRPFTPAIGQAGGDIIGLKVGDNAADTTTNADGTASSNYTAKPFTIDSLVAGNGGIGAKGGDIRDVTLMGDTAGLKVVAGDGGKGITGGAGGSIANLADLGSSNGVVQIHTGNGGEGFLGAAGSAGSLSFGTFLMNGDISIGLGTGGNALGNTGAGTSFLKGTLSPTDANGLSSAVNILATYRGADDLGSQKSIDFNNDGFTDIVFLTNTPDQLGVKFGGLSGIKSFTPTLYFAAPSFTSLETGSSAVIVGDFNGDTYPDIATASSEANSTDGLHVFLNPGGVGSANGWAQAALKTDGGNYIDSSLRSAVPSLNPYHFLRSGAAISDLAAGDFNGDGVLDLAYTSQSYVFTTEVKPVTTAVMLTGAGDGRFFADFQFDRTTNTQTFMPVLGGGTAFNGHGDFVLQATTADTSVPSTSSPNLLVLAESGNGLNRTVRSIQFLPDSGGGYPAGTLQTVGAAAPMYGVPIIKDGIITGYTPTPGTPLSVSIADIGGDGIFDVVVLNASNAVTVLGGASDATFASNDGIILVGEQTLLGPGSPVAFLQVKAGTFDDTSSNAQFALYSMGTGGVPKAYYTFELPAISSNLTQLQTLGAISAPYPGDDYYNAKIIALDAFKTDPADTEFGFVSAYPTTTGARLFQGTGISSTVSFGLNINQIDLLAGDGGTSYLGAGGAGGSFGTGTVTSTTTGGATANSAALTLVIPATPALQPDVYMRSGDGGSGFTNGGAGGGVSGLLVKYADAAGMLTADIDLYAADGGAGLTGTGGAGGSLSGMKMESGSIFSAGDGGFGFNGGVGGGINGNSGVGGYTTYHSTAILTGGAGGVGIASGGNGGTITGFATEFPSLIGGVGGYLSYTGGDGGFSLAGKGGSGGSILNSSPINANNNLVGPILIQGGAGADGLTGGFGGSISNFSNLSTVSSPVTVVSILAGNGGTGVTGNGGNGGSVSTIVASGTGIYSDPSTGEDYAFNRVLAGDGGASFGAQGGSGGSLSNVTTTANSSATAIASGHGGDGLKRGGDGGTISGTSADSAAGVAAKVIVWAGSGGNAFAALATASNVGNAGDISPILNLRAFGGVNGVGGNGGSITNFSQPKTVYAGVDLIAGNGGSVVNYGSPGNSSTGVGKGGSLSGITLAGEAGRVDETVAIKSYGSDFVQTVLRGLPATELDDSLGNVGVIAGVAGRVKGDLPAGDAAAKTGSVTNFTARSIMSMVAGSVDRIAAINTISGINLTSPGGVLGAYKTVPVGPQIPPAVPHGPSNPLYYNSDGVTENSTPEIGGVLMDGAVLAQNNNSGLTGSRLFVL